ncbi:hypothetical protein PAUR_a1695 [Pseudoalteromonas aurantia 208]|uniref:Orphan protein n=1 Tax=Pseudoalteromonas aurantia 208 TaxID=1314867 RepID=A0ABR9EAX5_9GAMM|nr:hypothetical protein [Pseudoalteromonas aurantia 208]
MRDYKPHTSVCGLLDGMHRDVANRQKQTEIAANGEVQSVDSPLALGNTFSLTCAKR